MLRATVLLGLSAGLVMGVLACEPLVRCSNDTHCPFDRVCDVRQNLCLEKDDPSLPDGGSSAGGGTGTGTTDGGTDGGTLSDGGTQGISDAGCTSTSCGVQTCCPNGSCAAVCL